MRWTVSRTTDSRSYNGAEHSIQHTVVRVMRVDKTDISLVPDLMGAPHDVIDYVCVAFVESTHALDAGSIGRHQFREIATFDLQHLGGARLGVVLRRLRCFRTVLP